MHSLKNKIQTLEENQRYYEEKLQELRQRSDIHYALNELLQTSLLPLSLNQLLDRMLIVLLEVKWLALDKKGSIFLKSKNEQAIDLVVEYNLGSELQKKCKKVSFGTCLCGKAAATERLVFKSCLDEDHHHRPKGVKPHGHYCIPIKKNDTLLGVLNLYVKHDHQSTQIERDFLSATANVIAGTIERKKLEEKLIQHSLNDELTGLPNRRLLYNNLNNAIERAKRFNNSIAVFFIDVNKFKPVNDTFGHKVGDILLKKSAQRMLQCLRSSDTLARLGGDEFLLLLDPTGSPLEVEAINKRLIHAMAKPFVIQKHQINIGISVGISHYPQDGDKAETLIQVADERMYQHKKTGI
ncbi:MAG: sensor domain-containing diguanylate cyclase [Enterobacterales bacterium]|nr:sensor domain-containing diguanylate cyclase [Enterobacterales bacterium]